MRLTLIVLILSVACAVSAEVKAPTGPVGPIAVVNLEAVINNAQLFTTRMEKIKKDGAEAETRLDDLEKQEKDLKGRLDLMPKTNADYRKVQEELEVLRTRRKLFLENTRSGIERQQGLLLADCYEQVRAHLKTFCVDRGLKLVHLAPQARLHAAPLQDMLNQLGQQALLYYDDSLDITEPFLAYLNARFAADGGEAALATPKPDADTAAPAPALSTPTAPVVADPAAPGTP
ncbi:MAG: OmpH family outer membrane protein [Planctomycetes bacterium]|nr:OmpH family outer membrane protein [Planctomycetota bacterium]